MTNQTEQQERAELITALMQQHAKEYGDAAPTCSSVFSKAAALLSSDSKPVQDGEFSKFKKEGWRKECDDTDSLLKHLGLDPSLCRTDGGWLNLLRIKALLAADKPAESGGEVVAWVERDGELIWHNRVAAVGRNLYIQPQPSALPDDVVKDALAKDIFTIFQGWQSATFGWQDDEDIEKAGRNFEAAKKAHDDECVRRIRVAIDAAMLKEGK